MPNLTWKHTLGRAALCLLAMLALAGCLPLQFGFEPPSTAAAQPTRLAQATTALETTAPLPASPVATHTRRLAGSSAPGTPSARPRRPAQPPSLQPPPRRPTRPPPAPSRSAC